MIRFIAEICTFFIPFRTQRQNFKKVILNFLYGYKVRRKAKTVGKNLDVRGYSVVTSNTVLGNFVHLNGIKISGIGNIRIGNYFHSGVECLVITSNHDYDNGSAIPYGQESVTKDVIIDDFVWIGSRVMILPGTHIGEGAIIQGGAVVHGEIPPYAIAGGNPAKVFKYRDIEHFQKLKTEKKYS